MEYFRAPSVTLAIPSHTTLCRAQTRLDSTKTFWYNTTMSNTDTISDSLSRINLDTHPMRQGFKMTFQNRITVSIRWGEANYSDGKTTAECAAWNADTHKWIHVIGFNYYDDDVLGHLNSDDVAKFIYMASTMTLGVNG
jgi:hypothetical protein